MKLADYVLSMQLLLFVFSLLSTANAQQSTWQILAVKGQPHERHEDSFVALGNRFYLMGGRGIKPVDIFDPKTNTWTTGEAPPIELHHFQAVAYHGKIYVIGAMTGKYPREKPLKRILSYNPRTDSWAWEAEIPENRRRGSAGVVVTGDKALVFCGITDGHWDGHVAWVDEFNFKTGEWKIFPDAPRPRDHFHAAVRGGIVFCAGGRNSSAKTGQTFNLTIPQVDVFDIKNQCWTTLPETGNIPTERAGASSLFFGNQLLVIGGESADQDVAHNEVEAYDIHQQSWHKLPSLQTGRHGTQTILYKGAVYIVAGCGKRGGKPELFSMEKFVLKD